ATFGGFDGDPVESCGPLVELQTCIFTPGICPGEGVITVTWRITDFCGNFDEVSQTFGVVDSTPPVITSCPGPDSISCDGGDPTSLFVTPTASDLCDSSPVVAQVGSDVVTGDDTTGCYSITRTWKVTDECGNQDNANNVDQTITVFDNVDPVIDNTPASGPVDCNVEHCFTITATDNCDSSVDILIEVTGGDVGSADISIIDNVLCITFFLDGEIFFDVTATDDCGNDVTESFALSSNCFFEACSPGYWGNHHESFPDPPYAFDTLFVDAFSVTPDGFFNASLTLDDALHMSGGVFNQTLFHGTAALLAAEHSGVDFSLSVAFVIQTMQDAFDGNITFAAAKKIFASAISADEAEGGCPLPM
ncbi:MAG: hypothetical protein IID09_06990, partial [Candidatus Hydrogenedentes bacterium]|nr:hypothetical protein [Candidatus Hydrogenedentota bacterium]